MVARNVLTAKTSFLRVWLKISVLHRSDSVPESKAQRNAPANHWKCRGVLWVGLQELHQAALPPGIQYFSG